MRLGLKVEKPEAPSFCKSRVRTSCPEPFERAAAEKHDPALRG